MSSEDQLRVTGSTRYVVECTGHEALSSPLPMARFFRSTQRLPGLRLSRWSIARSPHVRVGTGGVEVVFAVPRSAPVSATSSVQSRHRQHRGDPSCSAPSRGPRLRAAHRYRQWKPASAAGCLARPCPVAKVDRRRATTRKNLEEWANAIFDDCSSLQAMAVIRWATRKVERESSRLARHDGEEAAHARGHCARQQDGAWHLGGYADRKRSTGIRQRCLREHPAAHLKPVRWGCEEGEPHGQGRKTSMTYRASRSLSRFGPDPRITIPARDTSWAQIKA